MDLEGEREVVGPNRLKKSTKNGPPAGLVNNQMAGLLQDMVMQQAMKDKLDESSAPTPADSEVSGYGYIITRT